MRWISAAFIASIFALYSCQPSSNSGSDRKDASITAQESDISSLEIVDADTKSAENIFTPSEPRIALVIGNEAYPTVVGELANPHEDAQNVADALEAVGFEILGGVRKDADYQTINLALLEFQTALKSAGNDVVGFFYYSGHGASFESQGVRSNYFIPSGAPIESADQLPFLGVSLDQVIGALDAADAAAIFVVSDACRNTLPWTSNKGGAQPDRGFVPTDASAGMLLAYSTADGKTAPDDGEFARSLAKYIRQPGVTVDRVFTLVGREVSRRRIGGEAPVVSDRLARDVCLAGCDGTPVTIPGHAAPGQELGGAHRGVRFMSSGPIIVEIQSLLKDMGYNVVDTDGVYGNQTRNALAQFVADRNLQYDTFTTGVLDDLRIAASEKFSIGPSIKGVGMKTTTPKKVLEIQQHLLAMGYFTDQTDLYRLDSAYGDGTQSALRAFAQNRGLSSDPALFTDAVLEDLKTAHAEGHAIGPSPYTLGKGFVAQVAKPEAPAQGIFQDCADCPVMVSLPAGTYGMGQTGNIRGDVQPFAIGKFEVSREQFAAFVSATGYDVPDCDSFSEDDAQASWRNPITWYSNDATNQIVATSNKHPVMCVSHRDALAYIDWLNEKTATPLYRLPTEAEWEYAARAGSDGDWFYGMSPAQSCRHVNGQQWLGKGTIKTEDVTCAIGDGSIFDGYEVSSPIGAMQANGFGLHDMLGNAREWVADCALDDPQFSDSFESTQTIGCESYVTRGGDWMQWPSNLTNWTRGSLPQDARWDSVGFRVAKATSD